MTELWFIPLAAVMWYCIFVAARGLYRNLRRDLPVLWLLWRNH